MDNQDSPVLHGYSVGMYYSMPVLIELLLQITSGSASSIYTNSTLGQGEVNYESVVPMALLHSLVIFGGLSLGAAKIRQASLDCPVPTVGGKSRVTVVFKKSKKFVQTCFATHPATLLWPCFFLWVGGSLFYSAWRYLLGQGGIHQIVHKWAESAARLCCRFISHGRTTPNGDGVLQRYRPACRALAGSTRRQRMCSLSVVGDEKKSAFALFGSNMYLHRLPYLPHRSLCPSPPAAADPNVRSSVNFFSFMVIKLVLAQIQFVAVLIVASVVLLPFITGAALLLWWDELLLVRVHVLAAELHVRTNHANVHSSLSKPQAAAPNSIRVSRHVRGCPLDIQSNLDQGRNGVLSMPRGETSSMLRYPEGSILKTGCHLRGTVPAVCFLSGSRGERP